MKKKSFPLITGGFIIALAIHVFLYGLTSNLSSEDIGHGFWPTEHYADFQDFAFKMTKSAFLYLFTLLGLIFNIIWTESGKGQLKNFWSLSTLRPLLISPIVFYSVYLFASKEPDTIVALLFSFQSGFFWQSVINRQKQSPAEGKI